MLSPSGQDAIFYLNLALRVGLENTRKKSIGYEILSGFMSLFLLGHTTINSGQKETIQVCHNQGVYCPTKSHQGLA